MRLERGDSEGLPVTGMAICQVLPHARNWIDSSLDHVLGLRGGLLLIPISYTGLPGVKKFTHKLGPQKQWKRNPCALHLTVGGGKILASVLS